MQTSGRVRILVFTFAVLAAGLSCWQLVCADSAPAQQSDASVASKAGTDFRKTTDKPLWRRMLSPLPEAWHKSDGPASSRHWVLQVGPATGAGETPTRDQKRKPTAAPVDEKKKSAAQTSGANADKQPVKSWMPVWTVNSVAGSTPPQPVRPGHGPEKGVAQPDDPAVPVSLGPPQALDAGQPVPPAGASGAVPVLAVGLRPSAQLNGPALILPDAVSLGRPRSEAEGASSGRPLPLPPEVLSNLAQSQAVAEPSAAAQGNAQPNVANERGILLSAARNAVKQGNYDLAIARYEDFFKRFGEDAAVRREYAGILISARQYKRAAEQFRSLIAAQPNNIELRLALADVYTAAKEFRLATDELADALRLAPDNLEIATRLARTHAIAGDVARGLDIYKRYLSQLHPGDDQVPLPLGSLLLELGRPEEGIPFLLALRDKHPQELELVADLIRSYARNGERPRVMDLLQELSSKGPRLVNLRLTLAENLYQAGDYEVAGLVFDQVLQIEPGNDLALVGIARVHLQKFEPNEALKILQSVRPGPHAQRIYMLTWGEYHQLVGEYPHAKKIYGEFLVRDANDYEARLALAALYEYVRDYEKAKAAYAKIPEESSLGRKSQLGFAAALAGQRFFQDALNVCHHLLAASPGDGDATALMARILLKTGQAPQAENVCRAFLEANAGNYPACFSVRLALGTVLLERGKYFDAAGEFETLLQRPPDRIPVTYYGLARAQRKLGQAHVAEQTLASILTLVGGDFRNRLLLADLFAGDNEDEPVIAMCAAVLKWDAQNLAALIRLAAAQQRIARFTGCITDVVQTCRLILSLSPANCQARLTLARALATAQDYPGAAAEYDRLLAIDPDFIVAGREKARVLYSDHQFGAAQAAYQHLQTQGATEMFLARLGAYSQRDPRAHALLDPYLRGDFPPPVLRAEIGKLAASAAEPEIRSNLASILYDFDARSAEENGARLEAAAKAKKDFRNYQAIPIYKELICAEPANVEALFDLGQVHGTLKQTQRELDQYADVLQIEPKHREALVAQERASLEMDPQLRMNVDFFSDNGRGGLARIDRTRWQTWGVLPFGDENQLVRLGYAHAFYQPHDDRGLDGNILSAGFQEKLGDCLGFFGQANFEQYKDRIHDRVTYATGAHYDVCDGVRLNAGSFLENVVENGESMRQDIYRLGGIWGADFRPGRYWQFGGNYRLASYSDDNILNEFYLYNSVILCPPPTEFKVVLDMDYQAFSNQTILNPRVPGGVQGSIHPYFSPSTFAYYEARFEWTHWLSRDYFVHSNQCYYSLQYAIGFDSRMEVYNTFRVLFNYDVRPWLTIGAEASQLLSPNYDATTALGFIVIRFPCAPWR